MRREPSDTGTGGEVHRQAGRSGLFADTRLDLRINGARRGFQRAARYPLRTAPSIVAGQPERVQSPARNRLFTAVDAAGRFTSVSGAAEKVARTSLITCAFSSLAARAWGKNSASSASAIEMTSAR